MVQFHPKTSVLEASFVMHSPAIWVPDLKRLIFGRGSWWRVLKTPEDLRQITDADIDNVWYVQALRGPEGARTP